MTVRCAQSRMNDGAGTECSKKHEGRGTQDT